MSDIQIRFPGCDDDDGEGERGKRGHRGHDGATGATGATGPLGFPPVIAAARVNFDGTLSQETGFSASSQIGTGHYHLTLTNPPVNMAKAITLITIVGTFGGQDSFVYLGGGVIDVHTFNAAGVASDQVFQIVTYDLT